MQHSQATVNRRSVELGGPPSTGSAGGGFKGLVAAAASQQRAASAPPGGRSGEWRDVDDEDDFASGSTAPLPPQQQQPAQQQQQQQQHQESPPLEPKPSADLRLIVNQLTGSLGCNAGSMSGLAGARSRGAPAMASMQSMAVLRAAAEAVKSANASIDEGDEAAATGGAPQRRKRPPIKRVDSRFLHLPWWQRNQARLKHHWRVFRQQVNEDPAYADTVAHRWNKWLAITQFLGYNAAVVIIFVVGASLANR